MAKLDLALEFVQCRTWGHAWEDFIPHGARKQVWGDRFYLRCVRCGMERHDVFDGLGELAERSYKQPEGYKLAAEDGLTRPEWRLALVATMRSAARNTRRSA